MVDANDPAFPVQGFSYPNGEFEHPVQGMSLRVWMAGQIIAGNAVVSPWDRGNPLNGPSPELAYGQEVARLTGIVLTAMGVSW